ncbi:MAG: thioredoxin domain-containing protein [Methanoregula sp.]|nr:MAG: thioredoxin domain-containing protein [Methanoregula sp.]
MEPDKTDTRDGKGGQEGKRCGQPVFGKMTIALIIGIVALLIIFLAVFSSASPSVQNQVVSPGTCGDKVLQYVNQNLVPQGSPATLVETSEDRGLYWIKIQYQSQVITLFASKDCSLLFTSNYDMNQQGTQAAQQKAPVKSARPAVDLYVMAFCPYGIQAETVMKPVVGLLGSKADIRLRYITMVTGTTADSVNSLHGPTEAQEDLRQICIQKYYPEKLWTYVARFNEACYPESANTETQKACWMNASAMAGIDMAKITACASGPEGISLMKADEADSNKNGASGSPTLIINGVTYSGARTPERYKQAICNSYDTAPAECDTTLSTTQATNAAGGCG